MGKSANLPAKKYSAGSRTITRLSFEGQGAGRKYIDIGLALSAMNQRHYRSGVYYYVQSVEFYNDANSMVDIYTLPDNFAVKNAWNYVFQAYMKQNRLAGNVPRGKWHDFRVYMSHDHFDQGTLIPSLYHYNGHANSRVVDVDETTLYSQLISADDDGDSTQEADNFSVHMLGPHDGSSSNWVTIGAVHAYDNFKRDVQQSPPDSLDSSSDSESADDPIMNLFDFSSEEQVNDIIEHMEQSGDLAPYDMDTLQGKELYSYHHASRLATAQGVNRVAKSNGFCVPFGLMCVDPDYSTPAEDRWRVVINLVPGTYNGVYAERSI
jgi:hypothetical protein